MEAESYWAFNLPADKLIVVPRTAEVFDVEVDPAATRTLTEYVEEDDGIEPLLDRSVDIFGIFSP